MTDPIWQKLNDEITACRACPRLVAWREQIAQEKRRAYREWEYWGKPVPGFGDPLAQVLIIGLAPGAHGSNRTGRMFTGDSSGDTLYTAMHRAGFASQPISRHREDGLTLSNAFITAVARCAPPENRPTPEEMSNCRPFLLREWALLKRIKVIVALGQIAFDHSLRLLRQHGFEYQAEAEASRPLRFGHSKNYLFTKANPGEGKYLLASYHPSRQNTQTGRLTQAMLDEVFAEARSLLS
ncbi:MAG: uracil-DNA glycosylase [Anaerolineae bacterium]